MSYTTTPIANRLGYNRGWMFQLIPQNTNLPNVTSLVYLKSYFILKEYLRFHQINLLSFYIQPLTPTINLIHLMVYKHIRYPRKKPHPVFIDRLSKQGYFKVFNVFEKQQRAMAVKYISMVGSKNTWQNTVPLLQQSKLNSYLRLQSMTRKIKNWQNKTIFRSLNQSIKCEPVVLLNFMNENVQKLIKSKRKHDLTFIRQLRHLDVSLHHFCITAQNMQLQELILCMKKALNNEDEKKFKFELLTPFSQSKTSATWRNKTDKKFLQKNLKFLAKTGKKNPLSLSKLKVLLQSNIATRLRLAKKIMIYWKYLNSYRNQFYVSYHDMKLKSFLRKNLSKDNNITAIILRKSEEILQNYGVAKRLVFSILGLYTNKAKLNRTGKYMYKYNNIFQHRNKLNKNLSWLAELKMLKSVHKNICSSNQALQIPNSVISSQNSILKKNIKIKKEIYKPILNNQLQLNYLFESYLQNMCKIPSVVKVIPTSSNVWLKKTYNNFKSKPRLKRAAEGRFFKRLLFAFINAERYMAPQLIADLIANELTIPRKHKPLLRNINALFDAVHSRYILGYKIVVDGKLNGVMKSTKQIIKFKGKDKMPVQEFHKRVLYALGVSRTYTGLFGVRVWLYY